MSGFQIQNKYKNISEIYSQPIDCSICKQIVMAEFKPAKEVVTLFEFDPYIMNIRKLHQHTADTTTIARITKRVATEIRLLENRDPDDYYYYRKKRKE